MQCNFCGNENPDDATFCMSCGKSLEQGQTSSFESQEQDAEEVYEYYNFDNENGRQLSLFSYYVKCFQSFWVFDGRARRCEYWGFVLYNGLVSFILIFILYLLLPVSIASAIYDLYNLIIFLPGLAVAVRRMHDIDKSGWYVLIALIPIVGILIALFLDCRKGTDGPNKYGPDPIAQN